MLANMTENSKGLIQDSVSPGPCLATSLQSAVSCVGFSLRLTLGLTSPGSSPTEEGESISSAVSTLILGTSLGHVVPGPVSG